MLPKSLRAELREYIRDEVNATYKLGGGRPREVAVRVIARHKGLVKNLGDRLAEDAICDMARKMMKSWSAVGSAAKEQLHLPGFAAHLLDDLPAAISIPAVRGADDQDPVFKTLTGPNCATVRELREAVYFLFRSISDDQRKAKALSDLLDFAVKAGATDDMGLDAALGLAMNGSIAAE